MCRKTKVTSELAGNCGDRDEDEEEMEKVEELVHEGDRK